MSAASKNLCLCIVALIAIGASLYHLEQARSGLETSTITIGTTPATRYRQPDTQGPVVVVAHGFAGSRQLMQAYSLSLAQSGYDVIAFDFEGHGRNPEPMSGDVSVIDGTTRLLVTQTRRVIAAARKLRGADVKIALLGHSMATDVTVRAALAEAESGRPVDTIVGISMFSKAITDQVPRSLLVINGEYEGRLRAPALAQLQMVDPSAQEGDTATTDNVVRRVVMAPYVEHVSVLYSTVALRETLAWMDRTFERNSGVDPVRIGGWILLLLGGIVVLFKPLVQWLPTVTVNERDLPLRTFLLASIVPAAVVPLLALLPEVKFLPVLVADYLMLHLALYGLLQLLIIRPRLSGAMLPVLAGAALLAFWGIAVFGLALDRYAASFLPNAERLIIVAVLCLGTVIFMVGDSVVTGVGRGRFWRRLAARMAFIVSLALATAIDPGRLMFLLIILPVLILFYLVHGLMGRWVAQRQGALAAGVGLGVCLAWALGVSFPLFVA